MEVRSPGHVLGRLLSAALLPVLLLAGACGDDEPGPTAAADASTTGSPTTGPTGPTTGSTGSTDALPDCAEVWVADARLPRGYAACADAGEAVRPERLHCEFGKPLLTHADRFWAVPGGTVHRSHGPLGEDPDYRAALASCTA